MPKSLSVILNKKMVDFIKWCLMFSDIKKPSVDELLQSPFLKEIESEENAHPIALDTEKFKEYEMTLLKAERDLNN